MVRCDILVQLSRGIVSTTKKKNACSASRLDIHRVIIRRRRLLIRHRRCNRWSSVSSSWIDANPPTSSNIKRSGWQCPGSSRRSSFSLPYDRAARSRVHRLLVSHSFLLPLFPNPFSKHLLFIRLLNFNFMSVLVVLSNIHRHHDAWQCPATISVSTMGRGPVGGG